MSPLILKDSNFEQIPESVNYHNATSYIRAVNELKNQFENGTLECIQLSRYGTRIARDCPIEVEIIDYGVLHGNQVPNKCRFSVSHYIGFYGNKDVCIKIEPRFGNQLLSYFLDYAANVFLPPGELGVSEGRDNPFWLLALLWRSLLKKALTTGQIPKSYIEQCRNLRTYKGRIDINKNLHYNLANQSQFYCKFRTLSLDNTINRSIRHTIRILKRAGLSGLLTDLISYDERLASFDVQDTIVDLTDLDKIRFTKMNIVYRPVVNLCKSILRHDLSAPCGDVKQGISYMVDVAELWEMYLLRLLQMNLPEYYVYSPNASSGDYLLEGGLREIRPDIIVERNQRVLLVIDAKYKLYNAIGKYGSPLTNVQREDLYQMNTYLYHYGSQTPITGIFTSPVSGHDEIHSYTHNSLHKIGLVNLNIEGCCYDIAEIKNEEKRYIERIRAILDDVNNR